jgi:Predicted Zn-dependent proteases and their inactivated homologs
MIELTQYQRALERLPRGIAEAEANAEEHAVSLVELRGGRVSGADQSESRALYLRVSGDRTGYLYTEDIGEDAQDALREALANGQASEAPGRDLIRRGQQAFARDFGHEEAVSDLARIGEAASAFERSIRGAAPALAELQLSLRAETIRMRTISSQGLDTSFARPLYIMSATAFSERGGRRYSASYNRTSPDLTGFSAGEFGRELSELLECQYDPKPFRSGRYRAVLRRNVVYNILSTAWQLFSGARYVEGSSLFAGRLGETIAAPCVNIEDYPSMPLSGFDLPCDCEGSPGVPARLVEGGNLAGLVHNLATAEALGQMPTGNAGRRPLLSGSIPTAIQATPRNVCIKPGVSSLGEMLGRLGEGLFVTGSFDVFHSINIASGDFSIPCRAVAVRGGERAEATGPLVLSGNLEELLKGVEEVGRDFYLGTMLALDNYGIGACSLRVGELEFSGA